MKNILLTTIITLSFITSGCYKNRETGDGSNIDSNHIDSMIAGAIKQLQKKPDSAILILKEALALSKKTGFERGIGESLEFTGVSWFYKFNYDSAIYYHNRAYDIFQKSGNKNRMALVLFSLSYDYSLINDLNKSLDYAEKSRKLYESTVDYIKIYDCIEALIYLHRQLHNTQAVDSLMKELTIVADKTNNKKKIANSYITLGSHYIDRAYLNLAIEAFYKALKIAEETGDSVEIANAMGSVGLANLYLQDYEKAIQYYLQQATFLKKQNDLYELSITYTNLGEAYNSEKKYDKGLEYHMKALELRKKMSFKIAISNSLHNTAYTYYLMKDSTDKALKYVSEAVKINMETGNNKGFAKSYMLLGKIQLLKGDFKNGIRNLEKSLSLAQQYYDPNIIQESSAALSEIFAQRHNYEKAFRNLIINNHISDSIVTGKNVKRITQLEMQHEFDRKQSEIELSHLQESLNYETTLRRNRIVITFSFILASFIIVFVFYIYKNYLKSRKADKEKEALLREIHHRVKNNLMVISSLLNLQSGSITDDHTKSAVRESQSRVKSMALIHQLLYQSERFTSIDFPKYLEQLLSSLQSSYCKPGSEITYHINADNIPIDIDMAIPLGLITNELATNAYKYAFTECRSGIIDIEFTRTDDKTCRLKIADNGRGFPVDVDPFSSDTLGLKLVKILTRQIKARLDFNNNNGTEFLIVFPRHA